MASAVQSITGNGAEFEADATQRLCTLNHYTNWVLSNRGNDAGNGGKAAVHLDAGAVVLTEPAGAGVIPLPVGSSIEIPAACRAFTFKATASCMLVLSKA